MLPSVGDSDAPGVYSSAKPPAEGVSAPESVLGPESSEDVLSSPMSPNGEKPLSPQVEGGQGGCPASASLEQRRESSIEYARLGKRGPLRTYMEQLGGPMLQALVNAAYSIINSVYVSRSSPMPDAATSAMSLASPFEYVSSCFGWALMLGGSSVVSELLGREDRLGVSRVTTLLLLSAAALGLCVAAVVAPFLKLFIRSMASAEEGEQAVQFAYEYALPLVLGSPISCLYFASCGIASGFGFVKLTASCNLAVFVLDIGILAPALLFGARLGPMGSSIAYVCTQALVLAVYAYFLARRTSVQPDIRSLRGGCREGWRLMGRAAGVASIDLAASVSGIVVQTLLASTVSAIAEDYGQQACVGMGEGDGAAECRQQHFEQMVAAWGCLNRLYQSLNSMHFGAAEGYLAPASYALGMKAYSRFARLTVDFILVDCLLLLLLAALFEGIAPYFAYIFSPTEGYIEIASVAIRIMCATSAIMPLQFIVSAFCQVTARYALGLGLTILTQVLILPCCFVMFYFVTGETIEDALLRFKVYICSFNLNDVLSGAIALAVILVYLRRYQRARDGADLGGAGGWGCGCGCGGGGGARAGCGCRCRCGRRTSGACRSGGSGGSAAAGSLQAEAGPASV